MVVSALVSCFLVACASPDPQESPSATPPNIIYILADDLGYGDVQALNPEAQVQTPHLDRIEQEGMHFTDAHSPSAVCTPTRYGVLTGRYAWRSRLKSGVLVGVDSMLIEPDRKTVGHLLQENGYHTGVVGKWHLGLDWVKQDLALPLYEGENKWGVSRTNIDYTQPVTNGPNDVGFDYSFIIPSSLDIMPYLYLENNAAVEPATDYTAGMDPKVEGRGIFWRAGEVAPGFVFDQVMATFTEKAVAYLEARAEAEEPFFLYVPLSAPHTPWLPTDTFKNTSGAGDYGDFVHLVDASVGQVLDALDRLNLAENTLVIFTSDNGAHWTPADKEKFEHRPNAAFRGQKADIWEGGHRVPFLVRWPAQVASNSQTAALASHTDLMATAAALVGQPLPSDMGEDSYPLLPLLGASSDGVPREAIIHHSVDGMFAIRQGDWKLILGRGSGGFSAPRRVTPEPGEPDGQLYNLADDPGEATNLYAEQPNIVAELTALLEKYQAEGRSVPSARP